MIEIIGWFGSIFYSVAGWPQVIKTVKKGNANGVSLYFLLLMILGAITFLVYSFAIGSLAMVFCNSSTFLSMLITAKYVIFPRESKMSFGMTEWQKIKNIGGFCEN